MNEDNSTRLAEIWENRIPQIIAIFPIIWMHHKNGDWFILKYLENKE